MKLLCFRTLSGGGKVQFQLLCGIYMKIMLLFPFDNKKIFGIQTHHANVGYFLAIKH